jgi:hypothetical protein
MDELCHHCHEICVALTSGRVAGLTPLPREQNPRDVAKNMISLENMQPLPLLTQEQRRENNHKIRERMKSLPKNINKHPNKLQYDKSICNLISDSGAKYCAFITDIEGDFDYLIECFKCCPAAFDVGLFNSQMHIYDVTVKDEYEFVFGGDSQDHVEGDIRVVRQLLYLKKKFPKRVHLIAGNRDINKLRLYAEICVQKNIEDDEIVNSQQFPYWDTKNIYSTWTKEKKLEAKNKITRLKWILECTMGAKKAFEKRANELFELGKPCEDTDVFNSFYNESNPNVQDDDENENFMLQYLLNAQLVYQFHNTLFMHGGVGEKTWLKNPFNGKSLDSITTWLKMLNMFYSQELANFLTNPGERNILSKDDETGGNKLIRYTTTREIVPHSVVLHTNLKGIFPTNIPEKLCQSIAANGVKNVVSGHIPHGDMPLLIHGENNDVRFLTCDTSYSSKGNHRSEKRNKDTKAVCSVLIDSDGEINCTGSSYEFDVAHNLNPEINSRKEKRFQNIGKTIIFEDEIGIIKAYIPSEQKYSVSFFHDVMPCPFYNRMINSADFIFINMHSHNYIGKKVEWENDAGKTHTGTVKAYCEPNQKFIVRPDPVDKTNFKYSQLNETEFKFIEPTQKTAVSSLKMSAKTSRKYRAT